MCHRGLRRAAAAPLEKCRLLIYLSVGISSTTSDRSAAVYFLAPSSISCRLINSLSLSTTPPLFRLPAASSHPPHYFSSYPFQTPPPHPQPPPVSLLQFCLLKNWSNVLIEAPRRDGNFRAALQPRQKRMHTHTHTQAACQPINNLQSNAKEITAC